MKVFSYGKQPSAKAAERDVEAFKLERTTEMWKWFEKSLREIGYKGLCVNFDMIKISHTPRSDGICR